MRGPESPFERFKANFVFRLFDVFLLFWGNVSVICHIQFQWKVTEYFWNRIKKIWSDLTKITLEKKYIEIKICRRLNFYFLYVKLAAFQIWEQSNKFPFTCSSFKCLLVKKLFQENSAEKICLVHKQTPQTNSGTWKSAERCFLRAH